MLEACLSCTSVSSALELFILFYRPYICGVCCVLVLPLFIYSDHVVPLISCEGFQKSVQKGSGTGIDFVTNISPLLTCYIVTFIIFKNFAVSLGPCLIFGCILISEYL